MQADFFNAFYRHLADAEFLYDGRRWANADQLYGYSAECGLKCLMQQFGMPVDPASSRPSQRKDRVHVNEIWNRYEAYQAGIGAIGYELPQSNPFADWDISQRYAHESHFDQSRVDSHKHAAAIIRALIYKAVLEGRVNI